MSLSKQSMKVRELLDVILAADPEATISFALFTDESYAVGSVEITQDGVVLA
jgi:hypothetical protein